VTDSGGQGAIATDIAQRHGLTVTRLPELTRGEIAALLPAHASAANPVDLAGAGEQDIRVYGSVVATVIASAAVDAVVLSGYFGSYARDVAAVAGIEASTARAIASAAPRRGSPARGTPRRAPCSLSPVSRSRPRCWSRPGSHSPARSSAWCRRRSR